MKKITKLGISIATVSLLFIGCKKEGCTDTNATNYSAEAKKDDGSCTYNSSSSTTTTNEDLTVYEKIYGASQVYLEGDFVVIKTNGRPDHQSPYYKGTQWESTLYTAYNGTNTSYIQNPNKIEEVNFVFKIPRNPTEASNKAATPLGPIGVSLNGVAFFNQNAAPGDDLSNEINTFDQYEGHPQQQGMYHYHLEPTYLTATKGSSALLGFLLDGFPVYGPMEDGKTVTNADLDNYHGHTHATSEYPNGIYHYHITSTDPYINGDGFYGTAGTVTQ